jgi:hypothetical protein
MFHGAIRATGIIQSTWRIHKINTTPYLAKLDRNEYGLHVMCISDLSHLQIILHFSKAKNATLLDPNGTCTLVVTKNSSKYTQEDAK